MANYYIDTEFLEGIQRKRFFGIPTLGLRWDKDNCLEIFKPYTQPTIDLISIGIVAEDGREYYAISKDFNLKEAWNRYDLKLERPEDSKQRKFKEYWIRENVLRPIFDELLSKSMQDKGDFVKNNFFTAYSGFSFGHLEALIKYYGKTNKQIAEEIISFTTQAKWQDNPNGKFNVGTDLSNEVTKKDLVWDKPKFYAYYADYDWVAFCWLFGKMMGLPSGFPMYCIDLKQEFDKNLTINQEVLDYIQAIRDTKNKFPSKTELEYIFYNGNLKDNPNYPKQENEHNALADARWNKKLHDFLNNL